MITKCTYTNIYNFTGNDIIRPGRESMTSYKVYNSDDVTEIVSRGNALWVDVRRIYMYGVGQMTLLLSAHMLGKHQYYFCFHNLLCQV